MKWFTLSILLLPRIAFAGSSYGHNSYGVGQRPIDGSTIAPTALTVGVAPSTLTINSSGGLQTKSSITASSFHGISGSTTVVLFTSAPYMNFGGTNDTLGSGSTFFNFLSESGIMLTTMTITVIANGASETASHTFYCGTSQTNAVYTVIGATSTVGLPYRGGGALGGPLNVAANTNIACWMQSTSINTPKVNLSQGYKMQ